MPASWCGLKSLQQMLIRQSLKALAIVVVLALTCACRRVPDGVLDDEKMAHVLADLELADVIMNHSGGMLTIDSVKREVRRQVLRDLDVTPEQLDASMRFYGEDLKRYGEICDRAIEITEKRVEEAKKADAISLQANRDMIAITSDADTVNMWTAAKTYRITPAGGNAIIPFALPTDHNARPGDSYLLRFKAIGQGEPIFASLAADYNGLAGTDYRQTHSRANQSNWVSVTLKLNPQKSLKEIYGAIGVDVTNCTVWIDSISLTRIRPGADVSKMNPVSR